MTSMLIFILIVALVVVAPIPFLKNPRQKRSLAIMGVVVLSVGALAYLLSEERAKPLNLVTFMGLIGLFWLAGKFEAK